MFEVLIIDCIKIYVRIFEIGYTLLFVIRFFFWCKIKNVVVLNKSKCYDQSYKWNWYQSASVYIHFLFLWTILMLKWKVKLKSVINGCLNYQMSRQVDNGQK